MEPAHVFLISDAAEPEPEDAHSGPDPYARAWERRAPAAATAAIATLGCECPVCREPLFEALVSPCGHALCAECAAKLPSQSDEVAVQVGRRPRRHAEPSVPRCPICRAAVSAAQYTRCYPLEQIAQAVYADQWRAQEKEKAKALPPEDLDGLKGLAVWKAIREEQAVEKAMQLVWRALRGCLGDSTGLLVGRPALALAGLARMRPGGAPFMVNDFDEPGRPAAAEPRELLSELLEAEWGVLPELQRRLEAEGLALTPFRLDGANAALITWPALPPTFGP